MRGHIAKIVLYICLILQMSFAENIKFNALCKIQIHYITTCQNIGRDNSVFPRPVCDSSLSSMCKQTGHTGEQKKASEQTAEQRDVGGIG